MLESTSLTVTEIAYEVGFSSPAYFNLIATNPDFDIIRDDPRFLKILDEIGLASYQNRSAK